MAVKLCLGPRSPQRITVAVDLGSGSGGARARCEIGHKINRRTQLLRLAGYPPRRGALKDPLSGEDVRRPVTRTQERENEV